MVFDRSDKCSSEQANKVLKQSQNVCWSYFCIYICIVKRLTVILLTSLVLSTNLIVGIDTVYCCCLKVLESHLSFCKPNEDCSKNDPCVTEKSCSIVKKSACKKTTSSSVGLSVEFEQQLKNLYKDISIQTVVPAYFAISELLFIDLEFFPNKYFNQFSNSCSKERLQVFRC